MAKSDGGGSVGFGGMMGMSVLRDREADTYILYTIACISCSNHYCLAGNAIPIPDPRASSASRERTRGVGGRKKAKSLWSPLAPLCSLSFANLGLPRVRYRPAFDWMVALKMRGLVHGSCQ
jgi:hypothetical protein